MTPLAALTALSLLGYHLTFDAEMTSQSDMSQFINTFANGDTTLWNNHEGENYVPYDTTNPALPYVFANGALTITASPTPVGGLPYTSGMVETAGIFSQASGYFEIRAMTPAGQGFWPAFWLLPSAYYPEIDILEQPNNSGTTTEYWTHTSTPSDNSGGFTDTGVDVTQGYHRYGFLWTASSIQYVFDGNYVGWPHDVPPSMVGLQMYIIANLAVGGQGSWPGVPAQGASTTYAIDYIRAFSNDPAVPAIVQQPISSPDGVDTTPVLAPPALPAPPVPPVLGRGPDTLVLQLAEDAYQGDAQFTVSVDGRQWGGVQTTVANHGAGQSQAFTLRGYFGLLRHTVTVDFINNASGTDGDRNLFVMGASYNGVPVNGAVLNNYAGGPQSFGFAGKPVPAISAGSGPDTLLLGISQVGRTGNARYTVSVDGVVQTATLAGAAAHAYGQSQMVAVHGTFGPAAHTIGVRLANGALAGAAVNPADLYIDSLSYDGIPAPNSATVLTSRSTVSYKTAPVLADTLTMNVAEDAWQGDAQAQISVDGVVLDTPAVTASYAAGAAQTLSYSGSWGGAAVPHTVVVNFLNDAYAGPGQDRNLHASNVTLDGAVIASRASLMIGGPVTFTYAAVSQPSGWVVTSTR